MLFLPAVFGQKNPSKAVTKKVAIGNFSSLVVRSGVTIMLIEDDRNDSVRLQGDEKFVEDIKVFQLGKTLIVAGKDRLNLKKKGVVYIPVRSLQDLQINASAKIISYNTLQSPALNLLINGECTVDIIVNGKLNIRESEGYEFTYTRVYENSQTPFVKN